MSNVSSQGIRVYSNFAGYGKALLGVARAYPETPVVANLIVELLDPHNTSFRHVRDEITVMLIGAVPRSADGATVLLYAKVLQGSRKIKTVSVPSKGNSNVPVKVLCNGDDLTITLDTENGDGAIITVSEAAGKLVDLDDLTSILPRLGIESGLHKSLGNPISMQEYLAKSYPDDVFQEGDDADGDSPIEGGDDADGGDDDEGEEGEEGEEGDEE